MLEFVMFARRIISIMMVWYSFNYWPTCVLLSLFSLFGKFKSVRIITSQNRGDQKHKYRSIKW